MKLMGTKREMGVSEVRSNEAVLIMTTVPTEEEGQRLARLLVESRLAACVQILPAVTSIYWWESRLEEAVERLLLIKTLDRLYPEIERTIREAHRTSYGTKSWEDCLIKSVNAGMATIAFRMTTDEMKKMNPSSARKGKAEGKEQAEGKDE